MDSHDTCANRIRVRVVEQKLQLLNVNYTLHATFAGAVPAWQYKLMAHGIDTDLKESVTCHHANSVISTETSARRLP